MGADKYIDSATQEFDDWWYNAMTAMASLDMGFAFIGSDFVLRPRLRIGGGYDVISNGTDKINVRLPGNQSYDIPIDIPHRTMLAAGLGLDFFNQYFTAGLGYNFDMRSDFVSHTIMAKIKLAF